jgi:formate hydrogenlyase subunit 4
MPDSICPYFWKLLMAWVFVIPVSLFSFPAVIVEIITKESYGLGRLIMSVVLYIALYCIVSMVFTVLIFTNHYDSESIIVKMGSAGILIWVVAIVITVIETVKYFRNSDKVNDSVIVGFVKSKYNKYCARITWK